VSPISWVLFLFLVYLVVSGGLSDFIGLATKKQYQLSSSQNKGGGLPALPNLTGQGQAPSVSEPQ
jgi:hypothetical protein